MALEFFGSEYVLNTNILKGETNMFFDQKITINNVVDSFYYHMVIIYIIILFYN